MMEPITLSLVQRFELEKRSREIKDTTDVKELQAIAKELLLAWQQEIASSRAAVQDVLN